MKRLIKRTAIALAILVGVVLLAIGVQALKQYFEEPRHTFPGGEQRFLPSEYKEYTELEFVVEAESLGPDTPLYPANRLTFSGPLGVHRFQLYFVEAPERQITPATATTVSRQLRYFGEPTPEQLLQAGREALDFVGELLTTHSFRVLTSFDKPQLDPFTYAFIFVTVDEGDGPVERLLSELMVEQGWAGIMGRRAYLPYGQREREYAAYLEELENTARREGRGIWQFSTTSERFIAGPKPQHASRPTLRTPPVEPLRNRTNVER